MKWGLIWAWRKSSSARCFSRSSRLTDSRRVEICLLNTAEFVLSAYVDALVQAALHDPAQAGLELGDGAENLPVGVEKHRQNQGGAQAGGQESAIAYQIQRAEGRRGTHLLHQIPVRPRYAFIQADLPAVNAAGEGRLRRQGVQFLRGIGIDGTNELLVPG